MAALSPPQYSVAAPGTQIAHELAQIGGHARRVIAAEQALVESALEDLAHLGPVAPHDLHADEDDLLRLSGPGAPHEARVALPRARAPVADRGQDELEEKHLELQLEAARNIPGLADAFAELAVDPDREIGAKAERPLRPEAPLLARED